MAPLLTGRRDDTLMTLDDGIRHYRHRCADFYDRPTRAAVASRRRGGFPVSVPDPLSQSSQIGLMDRKLYVPLREETCS